MLGLRQHQRVRGLSGDRFMIRVAVYTLVGVSLSVLPVLPCVAQTDMTSMAHNSAANELGVLEYCQAHGHADDGAVAAQKTAISRLPTGSGSTDSAEALGKQGVLLGAGGSNVPLSEMASRGNTTESDLCTRMAASVKQAVASNPAMSMPQMPNGMPSMPSGMPAMPSGMPTMPSGMPTMPGSPSH